MNENFVRKIIQKVISLLVSRSNGFMNQMVIITFNEKCQIVKIFFLRHLVLIAIPNVALLVLESNPASVDEGLLDAVAPGATPHNGVVDQANQEDYNQQQLEKRMLD